MIRVLIVEDSVTQREILRRLLDADDELSVIGEARNGNEAIEKVRQLVPDVVLMDIHMPDMDGITATAEIMREFPVPIVIASATLKKRDVDLAMHAYEAGAVSVIEKPEGAVLLHLPKIGPELRRELIAASKAKVQRTVSSKATSSTKPVDAAPPRPSFTSLRLPTSPISIVGICASTGGPPVLLEILKLLPHPVPVPVLLVQHISHGFEEGFARWLGSSSGQNVRIASDGQALTAEIWIAPGGRHLKLGPGHRLLLPAGASSEIHCPSGNPLFESLAPLGCKAAGVLLTGMGDDGAQGLLALKQAGGVTFIQDEASCLIWGMPKVAQQLGAAGFQMNPAQIASALSKLIK